MSLTMYQATIPTLLKTLNNMSAILDKAESDLATRKIEQSVIMNMRLSPDMLPFPRQIFLMCLQAENAMARLAGREAPAASGEDVSFDDLRARIANTIASANSMTPQQLDGAEDRQVVLKIRENEIKFSGREYLFHFFIPNFYFHATTAYDILRQAGVPLGKPDFLKVF